MPQYNTEEEEIPIPDVYQLQKRLNRTQTFKCMPHAALISYLIITVLHLEVTPPQWLVTLKTKKKKKRKRE